MVDNIFTDSKLDQPHTGVGSANTKQTNIKANRLEVIATALDDVNLAEPSSPYHTRYPYNKVEQTLSGHMIEIDDTPGSERLMEMHKSGTFYEIHPDGTKVLKIFGDDFHISLQDRTLVVGGNLNITVQGDCNILTKGNVKHKIGGNLETIVHGNMTTRVSGNTLHYTKGSSDIQTRGEMRFRSNLNIEFRALQSFIVKVSQNVLTRAGGLARFFSKGRTWIDGSRVDLNLPGSDPGQSNMRELDVGAGLFVSDSVVSPTVESQLRMRTDTNSLNSIVDSSETITYPKDRKKID